jgi:uncharacterized protein (TIGR02646 family)
MRFIEKTAEPDILRQFKAQSNSDWQATYNNLQNPEKRELHQILLAEQGYIAVPKLLRCSYPLSSKGFKTKTVPHAIKERYICCYCGTRISLADSHIEHFQPQESYPDKQLDYRNLLVSCLRQPNAGDPLHCGVSKGNWYDRNLTVSPTIANCIEFFEYQADGKIIPSRDDFKKAAADTTIERLKLKISNLTKSRAKSLEGLNLNELSLADLDKFIDRYNQKNQIGQYAPFCQMLIYCLQQEKKYRLAILSLEQ